MSCNKDSQMSYNNKDSQMSSNNKDSPLHILMYPWFAFGHIITFIRLANKLAERGHKISLVIPTKTQLKLASLNKYPSLISFIPIDVPPVQGLPLGCETTSDAPDASSALMAAMSMTKDTMEAHLTRLKPNFVFYDYCHWLPGLARKQGIKCIYFTTFQIVSVAWISPLAKHPLKPKDGKFTEADIMEPPPEISSPSMRLQTFEAQVVAKELNNEFGSMYFPELIGTSIRECDAIGCKTVHEMEGVYCDFVAKTFGKPVLKVGPLVPDPPTSTLDEQMDAWLKGFGTGSVVYCALGTECNLEYDQFQELVLGLELTGKPFLAALKPPIGWETVEKALPEGFAERTEGRGIVCGWVQQQLILQHPSVGCFITHCAPGSLTEAMVSKCQLVMLPHKGEQLIIKLMILELKAGIEVERREEDGFFTRKNVQEAVATVMEDDNEVGKEARANHAKWRELFLREGVDESYISSFIQSLYQLLE